MGREVGLSTVGVAHEGEHCGGDGEEEKEDVEVGVEHAEGVGEWGHGCGWFVIWWRWGRGDT